MLAIANPSIFVPISGRLSLLNVSISLLSTQLNLLKVGTCIGLLFKRATAHLPAVSPTSFLLVGCKLVTSPQDNVTIQSVYLSFIATLFWASLIKFHWLNGAK